jgi:hypothetical protein
MALSSTDLGTSPDHYLHSFDAGHAVFVPMDAAAYRRSIFLDHRISAAGPATMRIPVATLLGGETTAQPTGWIFHMAHCGSTLLARALDALGDNLVLREPLALRQLAIEPNAAMLDIELGMLSKRYSKNALNIVKANVPVNFILDEIAQRQENGTAILLYLDLPDYLSAILRSEGHRTWLRGICSLLSPYLGDLSKCSDAQRAGALWQAQMLRFEALSRFWPRSRSVDAERFFSEPATILGSAARLLGVETTKNAVSQLVSGPLFSTYSKQPAIRFSNEDRIARRDQVAAGLASEIDEARDWLGANGHDPDETRQRVARLACSEWDSD